MNILSMIRSLKLESSILTLYLWQHLCVCSKQAFFFVPQSLEISELSSFLLWFCCRKLTVVCSSFEHAQYERSWNFYLQILSVCGQFCNLVQCSVSNCSPWRWWWGTRVLISYALGGRRDFLHCPKASQEPCSGLVMLVVCMLLYMYMHSVP